MSKVLQTPDFKSEEEEALWWDQNEDLVLAQFEQAAKDGTLHREESQGTGKSSQLNPVPSWTSHRLKQTA